MEKFLIAGIMSGTSLDGLDIALCKFELLNNKWNYTVIKAQTFPYDLGWKERLKDVFNTDALGFISLHKEYGKYIGEKVNHFLKSTNYEPDYISSHGHTVFHQPSKGITCQIGEGSSIYAVTGIRTISDFRVLDVALGGQGAPLVPIGDELLFNEYGFCLNLGGFANISYNNNGKRIAFDICPVNIVINYLANLLDHDYDKDGKLATMGSVNTDMINDLNELEFYSLPSPKSLGREWVEENILSILDKYQHVVIHDKLRTIYEHIAIQLVSIINSVKDKESVLVTGGGAYNKFLIELISQKTSKKIIIPEKEIIEFKEAIIFAFLGVLRITNQNNCLSTVTGASKDSCGGVIS